MRRSCGALLAHLEIRASNSLLQEGWTAPASYHARRCAARCMTSQTPSLLHVSSDLPVTLPNPCSPL